MAKIRRQVPRQPIAATDDPIARDRGDCLLAAVVDGHEDTAERVAARLQNGQDPPIRAFRTVEEAIHEGAVNAAVVSSRTEDHERQTRALVGQVEMAPVKEGIGIAAKCLHPKKARELIKRKTVAALKRLRAFKPYKPTPPHTLRLAFTTPAYAQMSAWIPGAKRDGDRVVVFRDPDLMEIMKRLWLAIMLGSS